MKEYIRLFEMERDYDNVIELWRKAGLILSLSDTKIEIEKFAKHNPNSFFVLIRDTTIIGAVFAAWDGRRGYINHLAIDPEYQRSGYGKLLMQKSMEYYHSVGAVKVHLLVEKSNSEVADYYKIQDWKVRDDLIMMTKTLRNE